MQKRPSDSAVAAVLDGGQARGTAPAPGSIGSGSGAGAGEATVAEQENIGRSGSSRKGLVRVALIAAMLIALAFLSRRFLDMRASLVEIATVDRWLLVPVLMLGLAYYLLKALRWHYYLKVAAIPVTLPRSTAAYLAGQWFTFTPAGELMRAYLLGGGTRFSAVAPTVVVQALMDFVALALMATLVVPFYPALAPVVLPVTAPLLLTAAMVASPLRRYAKSWRAVRWLANGRMEGILKDTSRLLALRPMLVGLLLGIPTVMTGAGALYLSGLAIGFVSWGEAQALGVYSMIMLVGGISPLPQGLGVTEGSGTLLLSYLGVDPASALAAILLFRVAVLGLSAVLGLIAFLALRAIDQSIGEVDLRGRPKNRAER